jgi:hypothetical protein
LLLQWYTNFTWITFTIPVPAAGAALTVKRTA